NKSPQCWRCGRKIVKKKFLPGKKPEKSAAFGGTPSGVRSGLSNSEALAYRATASRGADRDGKPPRKALPCGYSNKSELVSSLATRRAASCHDSSKIRQRRSREKNRAARKAATIGWPRVLCGVLFPKYDGKARSRHCQARPNAGGRDPGCNGPAWSGIIR